MPKKDNLQLEYRVQQLEKDIADSCKSSIGMRDSVHILQNYLQEISQNFQKSVDKLQHDNMLVENEISSLKERFRQPPQAASTPQPDAGRGMPGSPQHESMQGLQHVGISFSILT